MPPKKTTDTTLTTAPSPFSADKIELIRSQIAPEATDSELQLFLYHASKTGLDPLARQIYMIHRNSRDPKTNQWVKKATIQTSIDGFRVIAERTGNYAGQDVPVFEENDQGLVKCTVTIYKFAPSGERYPAAHGVAYWSEYAQDTSMWKKMPHTMLAKVAESNGLRKAFPQDLSGLYTTEEMAQEGSVEVIPETPPRTPPAMPPRREIEPTEDRPTLMTAAQQTEIEDITERDPAYLQALEQKVGREFALWTIPDAEAILNALHKKQREAFPNLDELPF